MTDAEYRFSLSEHSVFDVGKIAVDVAGLCDDVRYTFDALSQHVVGDEESLPYRHIFIDDF